MMNDSSKVYVAIGLVFGFLSYTFFIYAALPKQEVKLSDQADAGKSLWQKHNCTSCHQVYGLGGYLGPDLTNIYSARSEAHLRAFLKIGNNTMPAYDLKEEEILALLAYLEHLDKSGISDPRTFTIQTNGTIRQ